MSNKNNIGNCNSGNCNSGNWNSGNWNSGYWNSGDWNSGDCNSGNWNSGDWNSGNWNSGDWNSGAFNTNEPKMRLFNKELDMTVSEFCSKYNLYMNIPLARWVYKEDMSETEKTEVDGWETMGGYLKTLDFKEACRVWWAENEGDHERFLTLPGFDAEIFEEITGIDVEEQVEEMTLEEVCKRLGKTVKIVK